MKSSRYEILPRVRQHSSTGLWKCTWVEPIGLQQNGEPVRGITYTGVGFTADEAMKVCRISYMLRTEIDAQRKKEVDKAIDSILKSLDDNYIPIPAHCLATSNLPWWKRLFRV